MAGPVILAVDEDPDALRDLDQELNDRYARHYRVRTMGSALAALEWRAELSAAGEEVALILAGQGLPGMTGSDLPLDIHRDQQGFILTGTDLPDNRSWPLERRPFLLETSMPAVFGAGDVRHGSGSGSPRRWARVLSRFSYFTDCSTRITAFAGTA